MDSDKPSNPSSSSGNADDLIEEMAKLMGTSSPSSKPEPETSSAPEQTAPSAEPEAPVDAASNSDSFGPDEPAGPPAPEPVAVPRDTSAAQSGASSAPGWLPQSRRQPPPAPQTPEAPSNPDRGTDTSERQEPGFSLRPAREERVATPEPSGSDAGHSVEATPDSEPQDFRFSLKRETPRSPEPQTPEPQTMEPEPTQAAPSGRDFDFGFGVDRPAASAPDTPEKGPETPEEYVPVQATTPAHEDTAEVDPIADLIRDQLQQPDRQQEPEPSVEPEHEAQPESSSRADNFSVPPVFGLGGDTSKRSMSGSDALDDIENLIGNAVRVDLPPQEETVPEEPAPVPQPPVRPHQPRPAQPQNRAENVDAAEAAILAAMASNNGDPVPQTSDSGHPADVPPEYGAGGEAHVLTDEEQPRAGMRWGRILMPVAALLLLGLIGYAGYTFLTATPPEGEAPVLVADSDPTKVPPEVDETDDSGDSLVFSGDTTTDGSDEQLVSRDQSEEPTGEDAIRQIITADTTENGLANRRVRTVTVRPDGTIVRGDDLVAGGEALPVDRPEVPALPDDAVTSSLANTEVTGLALDDPASDLLSDPVETTPANLVAVNGESVPFPVARPADLSALRAAAPAQPTPPVATQPPATPQPSTAPEQPAAVDLLGNLEDVTPSPQGGNVVTTAVDPPPQTVTATAWVQLASQRDQAIATSEAGRLSRLYSSALGGRAPIVQQADLADRGTWYRVLVPADSLSEAQSICGQISNIGGDCFARAN